MTATTRKARDESIERALAKSEARFRRVVEAAPNAMVMISDRGQIEMVNAQAELVFGYPRSEMLGQPVEMLVPERFRKHHPSLRKLFFGDPKSRPMGAGRDLYGLRKDGSEFPVEIGLNPIETEDGAMVLSAIVDISDRKSKERRIEAALKEKEILLGEVHHRVKNNLQIIHSLLYLQAAKITDPSLSKLLKESQNRIKSMALIHQTLYQSNDFARVDFGLFLDTLAPTLVSSYAVEGGQAALSIDAAGVSLPINVAIPCGLIVNELISNALKHAFPKSRTGRIMVTLRNDLLHTVVLSVCDDGVGLPEGFDIRQSTTLGLQLVRLLADQLGAELDVSLSGPTRFELRFAVDS
jgi:two-component system, sensor histidine kinase PdtaS